MDSVNQPPKQAKVYPLEVKYNSSAHSTPYFTKTRKLSFCDCYAEDSLSPNTA